MSICFYCDKTAVLECASCNDRRFCQEHDLSAHKGVRSQHKRLPYVPPCDLCVDVPSVAYCLNCPAAARLLVGLHLCTSCFDAEHIVRRDPAGVPRFDKPESGCKEHLIRQQSNGPTITAEKFILHEGVETEKDNSNKDNATKDKRPVENTGTSDGQPPKRAKLDADVVTVADESDIISIADSDASYRDPTDEESEPDVESEPETESLSDNDSDVPEAESDNNIVPELQTRTKRSPPPAFQPSVPASTSSPASSSSSPASTEGQHALPQTVASRIAVQEATNEVLTPDELQRFSALRNAPPQIHRDATIYALMCETPVFQTKDSNTTSSASTATMARIRKALFHGMHHGTGQQEAEQAMRVAQRLMTQHQVSIEDANGVPQGSARSVRFYKNSSARQPIKLWPAGSWHNTLANLVSTMFHVSHYANRPSQFVFYGMADQVDQATLAFEMAVNKAVFLCRKQMGNQDHSFLLGVGEGMREATKTEQKELNRQESPEERLRRERWEQNCADMAKKVQKEMGLRLKKGKFSSASLNASSRAKGVVAGRSQRVKQNLIES